MSCRRLLERRSSTVAHASRRANAVRDPKSPIRKPGGLRQEFLPTSPGRSPGTQRGGESWLNDAFHTERTAAPPGHFRKRLRPIYKGSSLGAAGQGGDNFKSLSGIGFRCVSCVDPVGDFRWQEISRSSFAATHSVPPRAGSSRALRRSRSRHPPLTRPTSTGTRLPATGTRSRGGRPPTPAVRSPRPRPAPPTRHCFPARAVRRPRP